MSPVHSAVRPECYAVFSDESGIRERVLGYGGTFTLGANLVAIEESLEAFAASCGFGDKEFSWKKCSSNELDRYMGFADMFWQLQNVRNPLDFRAMLIDTVSNPLRAPEWRCNTDEDGFYKFYHFFITRSLENIAARAPCVDLRVAVLPDQYPYRGDVLGKTVAGRLKEECGSRTVVTEVDRLTPKMARIHQLADVLLGAVTYRAGNRDPTGKSRKRALCEHIESRVGRPLDHDFLPKERPFNVWFFASSGSDRWGVGARGSVGR